MQLDNTTILMFIIYKIIGIVAGAFFCYLGYKLFLKGFIEKDGELSAGRQGFSFNAKNIAPEHLLCC
jgi:hypothetical protein